MLISRYEVALNVPDGTATTDEEVDALLDTIDGELHDVLRGALERLQTAVDEIPGATIAMDGVVVVEANAREGR